MPADPILATGDVLEYTTIAESVTSRAEIINRQYYRVFQTPATATELLSGARDALLQNWVTNIIPVLNADYQLKEVIAKRVFSVSTTPTIHLTYDASVDAFPSTAGTVAGQPAPTFISASVWLRTGFMGRYWRGGMRLGGLSRSDMDVAATFQNYLTTTSHTAIRNALLAWRNDLTSAAGNVYRLVVLSPKYWVTALGSGGPAVGATADVTGLLVSDYLRTQLSRRAPFVP